MTDEPSARPSDPAAPADPSAFLRAHAAEWLAAVPSRRSRRTYTPERATSDQLRRVAETCERFRPWDDARAELVAEPGIDVFRGIVGAYGKVTGSPHLIVIVGSPDAILDQRPGYVGEAAVLAATAAGLGTCWVGGFFDAKLTAGLIDLAPDERILAVSALGVPVDDLSGNDVVMRGIARSKQRKPAEKIAPGSSAWPEWARAAVEAVVVAPSAMNRQPWRFAMDGGALVLSADNAFETPKVTKRLDCGIAMLHAELGALELGMPGRWIENTSRGLEVARYVPEQG